MLHQKHISTKLFRKLQSRLSNQGMSDKIKVADYRKGDSIYHEGDTPKCVYFMKYGWAKICRYAPDGEEVVLQVIGHNQMFGHADVLSGTAYKSSAVAIEYCETYLISKRHFLEMFSSDHEFSRLIVQMLTEEIWQAQEHIETLHDKNIDRRMASLLLGLDTALAENGSPALIEIPKKDLANIINVSAETFSRYLSKFVQKGWIDLGNRTIKVLHKDKLSSLIKD
ncbi:MAG: Crp/Fnr family transcriptional regulator [Salibacteraceae bacterium]